MSILYAYIVILYFAFDNVVLLKNFTTTSIRFRPPIIHDSMFQSASHGNPSHVTGIQVLILSAFRAVYSSLFSTVEQRTARKMYSVFFCSYITFYRMILTVYSRDTCVCCFGGASELKECTQLCYTTLYWRRVVTNTCRKYSNTQQTPAILKVFKYTAGKEDVISLCCICPFGDPIKLNLQLR